MRCCESFKYVCTRRYRPALTRIPKEPARGRLDDEDPEGPRRDQDCAGISLASAHMWYLTREQHKTMESVLDRGERIDDLVAKSENLSMTVRPRVTGFACVTSPRAVQDVFQGGEEGQLRLLRHVLMD